MRGGFALTLSALLTLGGAQAARAQQQPLILARPAQTAVSRRPVPPLAIEQQERLRKALEYRSSGQLDRARQALLALLTEVPHHPVLLTELARVHLASRDFGAVERLARSERLAQRDSVLLGHELALALERRGRPRDAAQVALETWTADPVQAEWASATVQRLGPLDPRGVRAEMRKAVESSPQRLDLVRGSAQLEWRLGDSRAMLRALAAADAAAIGPPLRWSFAEELLHRGTERDSSGAIDVLLDLSGDPGREAPYRLLAARRTWELYRARRAESEGATRVSNALKDIPTQKWPPDLLSGVVRGLREAGLTAESRRLLESHAGAALPPELALEQALADLKDGPPERALPALAALEGGSPEAAFRHGEALFFAGQFDSALAVYQRVAQNPQGPFAGAALERIYVIEDAQPRTALPAFGRIAYEEWRGRDKRAMALADSLYHALPRGPLWAHAALSLGARLEASGDGRAALVPLLALADSLPGDRLAPVACQRVGEIYLVLLKDEVAALARFEECLARYPRAWNAAEVRRRLETLRRTRRL